MKEKNTERNQRNEKSLLGIELKLSHNNVISSSNIITAVSLPFDKSCLPCRASHTLRIITRR